ncbi:hypothetical protein M5K25_009214 [Dendrobium thyrsiflorum]|uniref:Aspartate/glutamate/uridylate kinase domain-containing protein n=1 Tax=Dendrobium thyrsiflorum TaxID=117978 RepID=A0ABD0V4H7_DENTH
MSNSVIGLLQYDAFDIGFMTTDDFTNADILEETYPTIAKRLREDWSSSHAIPIITGFLGKSCKSSAVTTLGRGGSDLTDTTIGKALGLKEIQVWKDVDGVLTCDPNIHPQAEPVPYLTFEETAELAYFGAQWQQPGFPAGNLILATEDSLEQLSRHFLADEDIRSGKA